MSNVIEGIFEKLKTLHPETPAETLDGPSERGVGLLLSRKDGPGAMPIDLRALAHGLLYLDSHHNSCGRHRDGGVVPLHGSKSLLKVGIIFSEPQSLSERYWLRKFYDCDLAFPVVLSDDTHACCRP